MESKPTCLKQFFLIAAVFHELFWICWGFLIYALDQTIVLTIQKILRAVTTISSI